MTEMLGEENPERIAVIDNTSGSIPIVCIQISLS